MKEIPVDAVERMIELICRVQLCMRRARRESPLTPAHSDRLGQGIIDAEQVEEICRRTMSGRIKAGGNGKTFPSTE